MSGPTPHDILLHPLVTEKALNLMERKVVREKSKKRPEIAIDNNSLIFIVRQSATRIQVKRAFEELFDVKVEGVKILNTKAGKQAIIKLAEGYKAEDVGMRIGIF
jgi:large subunit ribosomal protein L23